MVLNEICPPALIYLIFSVTHVSIDTFQGRYNTAFAKIWVALVFTIVLNYLCRRGLGIISWFIVFIPFMLMTLIISILLYVFGLDPSTGRLKIYAPPDEFQQDVIDYRKRAMEEATLSGSPPQAGQAASPSYNNYYNQRDTGTTNDYARGSDNERDTNNGDMVPATAATPSSPAPVPGVPGVPATPAPPPQQNLGGSTDSHGCLTGAGYSWCSALGKCVGPGDPCVKKTQEGFSWPTLKFPTYNISAPLFKWPTFSLAADTGSVQLPVPSAVSMGCFGTC